MCHGKQVEGGRCTAPFLAGTMLFSGALYRVVLGGCCKGNIYKTEKLRT